MRGWPGTPSGDCGRTKILYRPGNGGDVSVTGVRDEQTFKYMEAIREDGEGVRLIGVDTSENNV